MSDYYDDRDLQDPDARERRLFARLPALVAKAKECAPGWALHLKDNDPASLIDRQGLAKFPILRKTDLFASQQESPPFGGFVVGQPADYGRVFMSPGPIWEPQGLAADPWRGARALYAAGLRPGDIVHNAFSYHLTPGGFILDESARALGCAVFPAGVGNTETQIEAIAALRPCVYVGTPDYLKLLLDKADEMGVSLDSFKKALVSGGALFPALREAYQGRGIATSQCYATADLGIIAYESLGHGGMLVNEDVIVEIVRPGTGDPVTPGEVGELVVTCFSDIYPLIRFATGDLSAILPGQSSCGRTAMRIKGWMGRADQRTKIKGMFVDPAQMDSLVKRFDALGKVRLEVSRQQDQDVMVLKAEADGKDDAFVMELTVALREVTKIGGSVQLVPLGSLPNDGKVIADERDYST
ncbi:phenylacetate--CoA ligase family protein [Cohaesibacter celericrescens]|uniref:AMP-dependent synthetase n=1 Tax=Cohaesibacter celericrescens TaxID=2067669 RepID=A0A2N5XLF3_9HYPH|nr:AMP-binding protein [Cohaesibacter celericrescens]PLW75268.1 AMP-dependent synthetase [Cohaesibacter celericrescens]